MVFRSGCRMERLVSRVLPWPYEVEDGSKRRVSSYWAFGLRDCWFLKRRRWWVKRAVRMVEKSDAGMELVSWN